eukprot:m.891057 g.891057  ORF g.891057 m.891057 type:complete len:293 (-) comp23652_c1_seq44:586-1464(-)
MGRSSKVAPAPQSNGIDSDIVVTQPGDDEHTQEHSPRNEDDTPARSIPADLCMCCFLPAACLLSWVQVQENTEAVSLHYGKYTGTVRKTGCHFINYCGRELRIVSIAAQSIDLPLMKVLDGNGNPLLVSGLVVFHVRHTKRAAIDVADVTEYVTLQATAVLKRVVSQYPYERSAGDTVSCSLQSDAAEVEGALRDVLQCRIELAGCVCESFQLNEVSFAPEIAAMMLKRQAAEALIQARQAIVRGAVGISLNALKQLAAEGLLMSSEEASSLVSKLLVVSSGDRDSLPSMNT